MKRYTLAFALGIILLFALDFVAEAQQLRTLQLCYHTQKYTVRVVGLDGTPDSCSAHERKLVIPYGTNCWDINGNRQPDKREDTNHDGNWNALDCRGEKGEVGDEGSVGSEGPPGQNCWDLNGNGIRNPSTEDTNGDSVVDVLDCKGPPISECASVEFPTADGLTPISSEGSLTESCPAGFFSISMDYQAEYGKLKAYYPNATSGGCKCVSDWDCKVEKKMIVLRCCK